MDGWTGIKGFWSQLSDVAGGRTTAPGDLDRGFCGLKYALASNTGIVLQDCYLFSKTVILKSPQWFLASKFKTLSHKDFSGIDSDNLSK